VYGFKNSWNFGGLFRSKEHLVFFLKKNLWFIKYFFKFYFSWKILL
jgi:hypothetical protein